MENKMKLLKIILFLNSLLIGSLVLAQVKVWEQPIVIPTWEIGPPELNPTFAWSSPRRPVYPYPYKEILTNNKTDKTYTACWLENEYVKVLVTPEIGGKLYGAKDKTNDYNFFYWQPTVKPALIGMTGAWTSGGIEWNFPHGHRPSGFSPISYRLTENADSSKTVWIGETEWVNRMRWVVGMTLYPGRSVIEAKVLLVNPTPLRHSYYLWATTATNTNENYQVIYPTRLMTDHGKYEYFHFPVHDGVDISWWKNVPNASSFFAVELGEFFGGYDNGKQAGTIITGNKYIAIGKKFWTWGTSPFGRMWDWILSDGEGPYIEPQAGAYSDNQPDNHWLEPGEVKSFSFFFYPIHDIGGYKQANIHGALNLDFVKNTIKIGVYSTAVVKTGIVRLSQKGRTIFEKTLNIDPANPFVHSLEINDAIESPENFTLSFFDQTGNELISYTSHILEQLPLPEGTKVFAPPRKIESVDELWHIGEIKSKYKELEFRQDFKDYFFEALKRDPENTRLHISLAEWDIKSANYKSAIAHLEIAKRRDPDNGKIFYLQAVAEDAMGDYESAYAHYYRAVHFQEYLPRAYERIVRFKSML
jgi:tetratricopeptide (TPR) repeat protein